MGKNLVIAALGVALLGLAFLYAQKVPEEAKTLPLPPAPVTEKQEVCVQVITPARDPQTGDIQEFPTPCDVPESWEVIQNDIPELELNLE